MCLVSWVKCKVKTNNTLEIKHKKSRLPTDRKPTKRQRCGKSKLRQSCDYVKVVGQTWLRSASIDISIIKLIDGGCVPHSKMQRKLLRELQVEVPPHLHPQTRASKQTSISSFLSVTAEEPKSNPRTPRLIVKCNKKQNARASTLRINPVSMLPLPETHEKNS